MASPKPVRILPRDVRVSVPLCPVESGRSLEADGEDRRAVHKVTLDDDVGVVASDGWQSSGSAELVNDDPPRDAVRPAPGRIAIEEDSVSDGESILVSHCDPSSRFAIFSQTPGTWRRDHVAQRLQARNTLPSTTTRTKQNIPEPH